MNQQETEHRNRVRATVSRLANEPEPSRAALTAAMHDGERRECLEEALILIAEMQEQLGIQHHDWVCIHGIAFSDECAQCVETACLNALVG